MKILAIDTVTENCSVALRLEGKSAEISEVIPNGHSSKVHGMVRELLGEYQVNLPDLDAVAVDIGPGSFTGVRIGIGVAQGLAFASNIPAIGIGSLAALAEPHRDRLVLSTIDARMGQVYWCLFNTSSGVVPLLEPMVTNPEEVSGLISSVLTTGQFPDLSWCGVGSGWRAYEKIMSTEVESGYLQVMENDYPCAASIATLAVAEQPKNVALLNAAYVRNDVAKKPAIQQRPGKSQKL